MRGKGKQVDTLIEVKNLMKIYNPGENEVRALKNREDSYCSHLTV